MDRQREQRTAPPQREEPEKRRKAQANKPAGTAQRALQALLAGVPLWDLAGGTLEELAGYAGNDSMAALAALSPPPCALSPFAFPEGEPDTAPFGVPETECLLAAPGGLLEGGSGDGL